MLLNNLFTVRGVYFLRNGRVFIESGFKSISMFARNVVFLSLWLVSWLCLSVYPFGWMDCRLLVVFCLYIIKD